MPSRIVLFRWWWDLWSVYFRRRPAGPFKAREEAAQAKAMREEPKADAETNGGGCQGLSGPQTSQADAAKA